MAAAGGEVAKEAVHHAFLHTEVDDGLVVTVVNAGKLGLLALLLDDFHLFHQLGRNVLGGQLRVVQEESLATDCDLGDGFTVGGDGTILGHFDAGEFLQQVHQHVVIADLEGRGVIFNRIFLDDDGITHGTDGSSVQHFQVLLHLDDAQVGIGP